VYALDDLKKLGEDRGWCPYFMTRHILNRANIVVYNYQYMLDPKVSGLVSRELEKESIVVFDEAHNIDNVCIEALSVTLDAKALHVSTQSVRKLEEKVSKLRASDEQRLRDEYAQLVQGLAEEAVGTHIRISNDFTSLITLCAILSLICSAGWGRRHVWQSGN
jgi:DNA excision repair protein ERCC-2